MADPLPPNPFPFLTPSYAGGRNSICRADTPYPSVSQESVPSQIDNLTNALYGAITKTVQNGRVIWNIPCDPTLSSSINGIPRNTNEGLLCYIIRALNLSTPSGFVTVDGVQTLTNKTLTAPVINNMTATGTLAGTATTATTAVNIAGGVAGSIPYQTGAGLTTLLPQGTAGQVLSTNGSGALGWITNSTTSSATNNINGGAAGVVPYQTGVNATGFTAAGTSGQVFTSNGTSSPTWSTNIAGQAGSVSDGSVSFAKLATAIQQSLVPSGAVQAFAMNTAPTGWLAADGTAVSRTTYANLFTAVGTTYGVGDGSTTFSLPDLRGIFVRGSGSQTISGTTYNKTFAAKERDAFQGHEHTSPSATGSGNYASYSSNSPQAISASTIAVVTDGVNGTPRTASETRPANVALLYCIKF